MKAKYWLAAAILVTSNMAAAESGDRHNDSIQPGKSNSINWLVSEEGQDGYVEEAVSTSATDVAQVSSTTANAGASRALPERSFSVAGGWLSDALRKLGQQAGFPTLVWFPDSKGELDFDVHTTFQLRAGSAIKAMEKLTEPYPIRLCFYLQDSVVQAIPHTKDCQ